MIYKTSSDLANLSFQERRKIAHDLCMDIYGQPRYKSDLAADIGHSPQSVINWFGKGESSPPDLVILYLAAQADLQKTNNIIESFGESCRAVVGYLDR